jgi:hypothetical protein
MIIIPINKDVVKYILSEYLSYSDICELRHEVKDVSLNKNRVRIEEMSGYFVEYLYITTYVDNVKIFVISYSKKYISHLIVYHNKDNPFFDDKTNGCTPIILT